MFVANATAGIKLVAEALRASPGGFNYVYHQASHTSLVGVREEAQNSLCIDDAQVEHWLGKIVSSEDEDRHPSTLLFAYPGQSNMDGRRYPLEWSQRFRIDQHLSAGSVYTLLDAAALASTSPLDLSNSETAPDFTVVSFSKIFGFPDLGCLIVRRQAESAFDHRKYFGGGTVETVVCHKEQWHAPKTHRLHERLEDGTLPIHSILALDVAIRTHQELFKSMSNISSHVTYLTRRLYKGLRDLRHGNGASVCKIYSPAPGEVGEVGLGPIVAFNLRNQAGEWVSLTEVDKLAGLKGFHIRTGGVCNPGGVASALDLKPWELMRNFSNGFRCGSENDIIAGKPTGVLRASLGAISSISDVDALIAFISEFYCEEYVPTEMPKEVEEKSQQKLFVSEITVYPVKSCGGYSVPGHTSWEVRPEGLAWDREWCLLHKGTAQALSQKRYPKMALIRPVLDFELGQLRIAFPGEMPELPQSKELLVPLSSNPALFRPLPQRSRTPRVCGEEFVAQTYASDEINDFFSAALGVPCMLARFPPGGQEGSKSARHSKAHLQKHQKTYYSNAPGLTTATCSDLVPAASGLAITPPSPPDSDTEGKERRRILLSNESPILAINMASVRALNNEIKAHGGGKEISAAVFRANIVLDTLFTKTSPDLAYAEDDWSRMRIGAHYYKMLGSCRRCHMVCIDQTTGAKGEEPFVTLAKTRRFDGKVFFGTHMCHLPSSSPPPREETDDTATLPTVCIGDRVVVE